MLNIMLALMHFRGPHSSQKCRLHQAEARDGTWHEPCRVDDTGSTAWSTAAKPTGQPPPFSSTISLLATGQPGHFWSRRPPDGCTHCCVTLMEVEFNAASSTGMSCWKLSSHRRLSAAVGPSSLR